MTRILEHYDDTGGVVPGFEVVGRGGDGAVWGVPGGPWGSAFTADRNVRTISCHFKHFQVILREMFKVQNEGAE